MGCLDIQCCYRQEGLRNTKEALHHGSRCTSQDSNPVNNTVVFQKRVAKTCVCVAIQPVRDVKTPCTVASGSGCLNPLNAELNPICHLLALLGAHHILHVSRIRVNSTRVCAEITRFAAGRCRLTCGLM